MARRYQKIQNSLPQIKKTLKESMGRRKVAEGLGSE